MAAAKPGKIFLELLDERPSSEGSGIDYLFDGSAEFAAKRRILGIDVKKRNFHFRIVIEDVLRLARDCLRRPCWAERLW